MERDRIQDELGRLAQKMASIDTRLEEACSQLAEMRRSLLHGNGQPPMISRIQQNADRIRALESATTTIRSNCERHVSATILTRSQVIAALIGLIGAILASCASLVVTLLKG